MDKRYAVKMVCVLIIMALFMLAAAVTAEGFQAVPDKKAWWQGGFRGQLIDQYMEQARLMRQEHPELIYVVQAWADMDTGVWTMNLTIGKVVREDNKTHFFFVMVLPGAPTPFDYRNKTGKECIMSYDLNDYEWFHGRNGDI